MAHDSRPLDDLDRSIIGELQKDGRVPNKVLAQKFGVSEATVSSRIRALSEGRVLQVVAQRDIRSLGFDFLGFVKVYVAGRDIHEVAHDLAEIDGVGSVTRLMGDPPLILQLNGRDRRDFLDRVENGIARVPGVVRLSTLLALDIILFRSEHAALSTEW